MPSGYSGLSWVGFCGGAVVCDFQFHVVVSLSVVHIGHMMVGQAACQLMEISILHDFVAIKPLNDWNSRGYWSLAWQI